MPEAGEALKMTTVTFRPELELWEAVAVVQLMQACGLQQAECAGDTMREEQADLFRAAGIEWVDAKGDVELQLDLAYRRVDGTALSYQQLLADLSGLGQPVIAAPRVQYERGSGLPSIVVCPFEINGVMKLPWQVWRAVIRHLRTYGLPVRLLAQPGQRTDYATFTEGDILSGCAFAEKLQALASAHLVFGVPNEWTWLATAWQRKIGILYPDDIPPQRWFGFHTLPGSLGRVFYQRSQLQVPVMLAGVRKLIAGL